MDDETRGAIVGTAGVSATLIAMLVSELSKTGAIDKAKFADLIDVAAAQSSESLTTGQEVSGRASLAVLRSVASMLRDPKPAWEPVVIQGGKDGDQSE